MYGDNWWGYLMSNGVVTITPQHPMYDALIAGHRRDLVVKVVGPFAEDLADELEGDQRMVRRRIIAAIYDKPLEEMDHGRVS